LISQSNLAASNRTRVALGRVTPFRYLTPRVGSPYRLKDYFDTAPDSGAVGDGIRRWFD